MTEIATPAEVENIVTADTDTAVLIARYSEVKREIDAAERRAKSLRDALMDAFVVKGASVFTDASGQTLLTRVEADSPQGYDFALLARLAPKALARAMKPRTKHYRLNLPRR